MPADEIVDRVRREYGDAWVDDVRMKSLTVSPRGSRPEGVSCSTWSTRGGGSRRR